ncbi:aminopeptidase [Heyndrickxia oleronia]|uniref:Aminopeptidase n=1 Tax=Heyndrickxia oleronia TaxID=38875 RepID=A0AAW6SXZ4_9BACI|nr:aminopeptidase [Heyndrickxia oleronia]MDH5160836.1 aminopeptidase [Heyndrickxia oleronia]
MMFDQQLEKYAELAVKVALNIQEGQLLWISAPTGTEILVRKIVKQAYLAGARNVHVNWYDEEIKRTHYELASNEVFKQYPKWLVAAHEELVENGGAFLQIEADDPDLLKGISIDKITNWQKAQGDALDHFYEAIDTDKISWSIIAMPSKKWADKVFPQLPERERIPALWEKIFQAVRIDLENPVDAWRKHISELSEKANSLNEKRIKKLHYQAEGTDLWIELPERHLWLTGSSVNSNGVTFIANMPTEEVYTVPHRTGVNGYVSSTKPLAYQGNVIEDFTLTFESGKIVDVTAKVGQELLERLIKTDEGASYLGEVALVPHNSPISNSQLLFFNTLFDENASNHLAIGSAYPTCLEGGQLLSEEERKAEGLNDSIVHEDFMIGSAKMNIDGILDDGTKIAIFRNGNWAF